MAKLSVLFELKDKYTKTINMAKSATEKFDKAIEKAGSQVDLLGNELLGAGKKGESAFGGVIGQLTKLAGLATVAKKSLDSMFTGVQINSQQEAQLQALQASYGDTAGSMVYDKASKFASKSILGREDVVNSISASSRYIQTEEQLDRYMKLLERLYAKGKPFGIDAYGASFAMKEIMGGDVMSIRGRFGINDFSGDKLRKLGQSGDMDALFDYIEEVFNKNNVNQALVEKQSNNLMIQWEIFTSNLKTRFGEASEYIVRKFKPLVVKLNQMLDSGKLDKFLNIFIGGMSFVADAIIAVVDWLEKLSTALEENTWVESAFFAIAIAGIGSMAVGFWHLIGLVLKFIGTLLLANLPLLIIISCMTLMIGIIAKWKGSVQEAITRIIMAWADFISIFLIAGQVLYNFFVDFAELIVNAFIVVINSIITFGQNLLHFWTKTLSSIAGLIDMVFGSNLKSTLNGAIAEIDKFIDKKLKLDFVNFDGAKAEIMGFFDLGDSVGSKMDDFWKRFSGSEDELIDPLAGMPDLDALMKNGIPVKNLDGDSLNTKIDKEDIKYLRDLAERDYVNKFSTLAPQIKVEFGDIHEKANLSIDEIRRVVSTALTEEIAIIGEGVY